MPPSPLKFCEEFVDEVFLFFFFSSSSSPKKSSRLCNGQTHQHPLSKSSQKYATCAHPPKKGYCSNRYVCWGTIISIIITFWYAAILFSEPLNPRL